MSPHQILHIVRTALILFVGHDQKRSEQEMDRCFERCVQDLESARRKTLFAIITGRSKKYKMSLGADVALKLSQNGEYIERINVHAHSEVLTTEELGVLTDFLEMTFARRGIYRLREKIS